MSTSLSFTLPTQAPPTLSLEQEEIESEGCYLPTSTIFHLVRSRRRFRLFSAGPILTNPPSNFSIWNCCLKLPYLRILRPASLPSPTVSLQFLSRCYSVNLEPPYRNAPTFATAVFHPQSRHCHNPGPWCNAVKLWRKRRRVIQSLGSLLSMIPRSLVSCPANLSRQLFPRNRISFVHALPSFYYITFRLIDFTRCFGDKGDVEDITEGKDIAYF
jgi:hypothetical protein